ncbi:MAG: exodeoxyribonuclease VII large subunit, partial [Lachnospiraceae bacterium]|nr:exodeoxyribonuclease VII large subunit [Lachnospiraceae bacterium]
MAEIYSVSQINTYIKHMFAGNTLLNHIYVKGEVSNCKYHTSGHIYFTLKDGAAQIACVLFAGRRAGISFRLEDGQNVIVFGNISVYERDGKYQLYADEIRQDGIGRLYEEFEYLKKKLGEEGLFDYAHKKEIPRFVKRVG